MMEDVDVSPWRSDPDSSAVLEYPATPDGRTTWRTRVLGVSQIAFGLTLTAVGMTLAFIGVRTQEEEPYIQRLAYYLPVFLVIFFGVSLVIGSAPRLRQRYERIGQER